jgi:hypothetical protein
VIAKLLLIVPSRGRPGNVARFCRAVKATSLVRTDVVFCFDDDDPSLRQNLAATKADGFPASSVTGPRKGLAAWTNEVVSWSAGAFQYLGSFGDDHVPVTPGWDKLLTDAIGEMGGTGIAYPNDGVRDDVCEAWIQSSDIVRALGWMCEPSLGHWYVDNVIHDLGSGAGCLKYLPDCAVPHKHHATGTAQWDATYAEAWPGVHRDRTAYETWVRERRDADVATVRALCAPG